MKYFIANWKANKDLYEAEAWIDLFFNKIDHYENVRKNLQDNVIKIIICPPANLIYPLKKLVDDRPYLSIGTQNISRFEDGPYTGEITAKNIHGLADFTIVGHSERRKHYGESNEDIEKKITLAQKYQIEPILCIRSNRDPIPQGVKIIAYEPAYAIGSGNNEALNKVLEMKRKIPISSAVKFLYGGSVNKENVAEYIGSGDIDGLLVGGSSLEAENFFNIINAV